MSPQIVNFGPDDGRLDALKEAFPGETDLEWVDSRLPIDELSEILKDTKAMILTGHTDVPAELATKCPELRLVQTVSAGTDYVDKTALGELGVKVSNNGGGNAVAVAEHTVTLIVGVYRKLNLQYKHVSAKEWGGNIRGDWYGQAHELTGKTVGIIGLGRIGTQLAKRLQGWDCEIIYSDVVSPEPEIASELGLKKVPTDELIQTADVVTLHVPLNQQTKGMISDREFAMMKDNAILINACRGPVVDEEAFIRAMRTDQIMAAGVDVLEVEPTPEDNPLIDMDNVLITPHMASFTQEASAKSMAFAMYNSVQVSKGEEPESVVLLDD